MSSGKDSQTHSNPRQSPIRFLFPFRQRDVRKSYTARQCLVIAVLWLCSGCAWSQRPHRESKVDRATPKQLSHQAGQRSKPTRIVRVDQTQEPALVELLPPIFSGLAETESTTDTSIGEQNDSHSNQDSIADDLPPTTLWGRIASDHRQFYSRKTLLPLGLGVAGTAIMANTHLDESIRDLTQKNIRNASSDEWYEGLHLNKELGNGRYTMPIMGAAMLTGYLFEESPLAGTAGEWGERSLRAILVGAPPMLALQRLTGGSRPGENPSGSHWHPFQDNNGVSGHTFMGAIPFLSAAKQTDNRLLRAGFYAGSALAGLSRINDDSHYASQVVLGWWMAYLATEAVDRTEDADTKWRVVPLPASHGSGAAIELRW